MYYINNSNRIEKSFVGDTNLNDNNTTNGRQSMT